MTETISKPVDWWNKQIKLDWSKLLSVVARTALKTASGKFDDAWLEVARGIEAVGLSEKNKPQVLAWLLIHKALARSVFALLGEARARNPGLPFRIEGDGAAVIDAGRLVPEKVEVPRNFLSRPESLPFLGKVHEMLVDWFVDLGVPAAEARAMVSRLDGILPRELHEEWRANPTAWEPIRIWLETPASEAVLRQEAWERATSKVKALPFETVFGEAFSLRDVFVPLRAYVVEHGQDGDRQGEDRKAVAAIGWLRDMLLGWIDGPPNPTDSLRVISGGPGSGKSSAARMLAAELADRHDLRVLYVPLHRVHLGGVFNDALTAYCRAWMFDDDVDPVDALEPRRRLVLFLDGLDELTSSEHRAAQDRADQFARELRSFLAEQNRQSARILVIVGGRELAIQSTNEPRFQSAPVLHVFPFAWNESLQDRFKWKDDDDIASLDQRSEWWKRFADITGAASQEMPETVSENERLLALTEQPLLNYLVASFARRHETTITPQTSVADVYDALIHDVYNRVWRDAKEAPTARDLATRVVKPEQFLAVLEEIALAVWHGNGRGAALSTIEAYFKAAELTGLIQDVQSKLETGISNLLLTFFFRKESDVRGTDYFEFTHKSFQEYLTARRVLTAAKNLSNAGKKIRDLQSALARWVEVTGPAMITREIADFMNHEAIRNINEAHRLSNRQALSRIFGYQLAEGLPVEDARGPAGTRDDRWPTRFRTMREWSDRAEVALMAAISAFAGEPERTVLAPLDFRLPDRTALKSLLERLSLAEYRDNNGTPMVPVVVRSLRGLAPIVTLWDSDDNIDPSRRPAENGRLYLRLTDLLGANLSGAILGGANLVGANLVSADLSSSDLSHAVLRGTDLRGANLSGADLSGADLSGADLSGADLRGTQLSDAKLLNANLKDAKLNSSNVRRAVIARAKLSGASIIDVGLKRKRSPSKTLRSANRIAKPSLPSGDEDTLE